LRKLTTYSLILAATFGGNLNLHAQLNVIGGTTLTIDPGTTVTSLSLSNDIEIQTNAAIVNNGIIVFTDSVDLIEPIGFPITGSGYETTTRNLNTPLSLANTAGFGLILSTTSTLNTTTIRRGHTSYLDSYGNSSLLRWFDVVPQNNTGLDATVRFHYDDTELNGLNESNLSLNHSFDAGTNWASISGGTTDAVNNFVEVNNQDSLALYTIFVPVESIDSTASILSDYCPGDSIIIPFTVTGTFPVGNYFTAQLSDDQGSFFSPILLDSVQNTTSDIIRTVLPSPLTGGSNYTVRVVASNGSVFAFLNVFTIHPSPDAGFSGLSANYCQYDAAITLVPNVTGGTFSGTAVVDDTFDPALGIVGTNNITYGITSGQGCYHETTQTTNVIAAPPIPTITQNGDVLTSSASTGNQWYFDGILLPGDTNQTLSFSENGEYMVEVTGNNGCTSSNSFYNIIGNFTVAPNPSHGVFTLHYNAKEEGALRFIVLDTQGKLIFTENYNINHGHWAQTFDFNPLPDGFYFLGLALNEEVVWEKLIVY
jgi:hypothetical protein